MMRNTCRQNRKDLEHETWKTILSVLMGIVDSIYYSVEVVFPSDFSKINDLPSPKPIDTSKQLNLVEFSKLLFPLSLKVFFLSFFLSFFLPFFQTFQFSHFFSFFSHFSKVLFELWLLSNIKDTLMWDHLKV